MRRPSQTAMAKQCDHFNTRHPVGSKVRVWTGLLHDGPGKVVEVALPGAYVLSGHTAVVQVIGGGGCVALSHVEPAEV
ncbi:hypothetical protein [Azorhizobium doebereinerae]|uniref:hypothetical protein n=1 Tax=Azorhizobium doebereinerae TaxID=281091 RepID=UPI0004003179|nr:hypothetical protein [Azorhizobium doebereinerae]